MQANDGSSLTATKPVAVISGNWGDLPTGCTDAVFDLVPPNRVLGQSYIVIRGNGSPGTATDGAPRLRTSH